MTRALEGRNGIVVDGTGKDYAKIKKQVDMLREIGYAVHMIFVNTDLETAQKRNNMRSRSLPDDMVKKMWDGVQKNIGKFQSSEASPCYGIPIVRSLSSHVCT